MACETPHILSRANVVIVKLSMFSSDERKSRRSAAGSAQRSGGEGRGFKSRRLDQNGIRV